MVDLLSANRISSSCGRSSWNSKKLMNKVSDLKFSPPRVVEFIFYRVYIFFSSTSDVSCIILSYVYTYIYNYVYNPGVQIMAKRKNASIATGINPTRLPRGDYAFLCPNCGRSYKYKGNLVQHLKLECGKQPQFNCPVCARCFTQKGSLKAHMGTLHGVLLK